LGLCVRIKRTHNTVAGRVWHEDQFAMDGHVAWATLSWTCFRFKDTLSWYWRDRPIARSPVHAADQAGNSAVYTGST